MKRAIPVIAAVAFFALEWVCNGFFDYGIFRDELYYVACTKRLALGYVDHPPLSIWFLRAVGVLGTSLPALRLWPALWGGLSMWLAVRLARRLGGTHVALVVTAIATAGAPVLLILFGFYSMNALELLLVLGLTSIALELVATGRSAKLWLAFGALAGLSVLNKHTAGVYVAALLVGMAVSPGRRALWTGWSLAGAALALLIWSPNLLWELREHWASLAFYRNATAIKNVASSPAKVVLDQVLMANPAALPILIAGLYGGLFVDRRALFVPVAYLLLLALLISTGSSRPDRVAALLPVLFAIGAVQLERWALASGLRRSLPLSAAGLAVLGAVVIAPGGSLPLLAPEALARYARTLGMLPKIERADVDLPQWFADRFGWQDVARAAERAAAQLTPDERAHAAVLGANYGYSSAVEHFARGVPPVIGRHNAWHSWGFPVPEPTVLLLIGFERPVAERYCAQLTAAASFTRPFNGGEIDRPIFVCRSLRWPLSRVWPELLLLV